MLVSTKNHRYSVSAGVAWLASQSILRQIISFGLFVVLGRLLNPVDFGTVGLCASIIMILQSIASYGVSSAVVQKPELTDDEANVAYTVNWLIAAAISIVILSTAALLGTFRTQGDSFPYVLGALALSPLLSAVYEIQQARMLRVFRFDISAKKALAAQIVGGIVAVSSAFAGAGVWSLVLQQYAVLLIELLIIVLASTWRPRFRIQREFVLHLWTFGSHLMGARFLSTVDTRVIDIIIGGFIDQASIGFYRVARNMFDVVISVFAIPIQSVALPYFASKQAEVRDVRIAFLEMTEALAWLMLPPFLTLAVWAPIFIVTVFGAKWASSGWILQILTFQATVLASFMLYDPLLVGIANTRQAFQLRCWQTGVSLALCLASASFGMDALVAAQVLSLYATAPIMFVYISRAVDLNLATFLRRQLKPYFFSIVFITAAYGFDRYFFAPQNLPGLLVTLTIAYIGYCIAFYFFAAAPLRQRVYNLLHRPN
ncbi:O-antigen/teichoic acid export membrane protein [Bradyrhizobium sp. USDA 4449]